jgi:hypothetical protein
MYSEEKTTLIINSECCPVTNVFNPVTTEKAMLLLELAPLFNVELNKEWVIGVEMREYLDSHEAVMLSEVYNYSLDLDPISAERTGRCMSLLKADFLEFFLDTKLPELEYSFVSIQAYELIRDKYFN